MRSCAEFGIDDCKTVNRVHYCYCRRALCNGENAESVIEKFGDINDEEGDEQNEDAESDEEASGNDDEDFIHSSTKHFESSESSVNEDSNDENEIFVASESTTAQATKSGAVTSNLSRNLLAIASLVYTIISQHRN